jgi:hypothetical protein
VEFLAGDFVTNHCRYSLGKYFTNAFITSWG